ncbi:MAG: alpha/beta hydrolase [Patescibacteria group bacterium]
MKKQIAMIHGGTTFDTKKDYLSFLENLDVDLDKYRKTKWTDHLRNDLGANYDVLLLKMPNPMNAKYKEWETLFNKIAPLLKKNVILIGHSLGAIFLVKYLSVNEFPKKIRATMLISPPYDSQEMDESLGGFVLPKRLNGLKKQAGEIFIYHSEDDRVVPYSHLEKYGEALPEATLRKFKKRGHFNQSKFPEIIKDIKNL